MHIQRFDKEIAAKRLKKKIQNMKLGIKKKTDRNSIGNRRIQQKKLGEKSFKLKNPGRRPCRPVRKDARYVSGYIL
jgi:hypothetical protein